MSARRRTRTRYPRAEGPPPTLAPREPGPEDAKPRPRHPKRQGGEAPAAREADAIESVPAEAPAAVTIPVAMEPASAAPVEIPVSAEGAPAATVEPARAPRRRVHASVAIAGFALLAFVTGMFVFNSLVMPRLIHGVGGEVTVPDLTNLTVAQAEKTLRPLDLQLSRAGERFDPSVPRGYVLSQDPEAGIGVRGRRRVSVMVSLGEEFSSVPELSGESVRSARLLVARAGLRPGTVVRAPSEEAGEGLVIGSDPGPEAVLQRDTPVHLLVSTGPGEESFVMPDLLGREITGVRRQLDALGLRVEMPPAAPAVGTIVSQEPAPGSRITRETVIRLLAAGRMIR